MKEKDETISRGDAWLGRISGGESCRETRSLARKVWAGANPSFDRAGNLWVNSQEFNARANLGDPCLPLKGD